MEFEIEIDSYTFYIKVVDYFAGYPAKTWGPWEDCYEECPEEIEWEITKIIGCDENGLEHCVGTEEIDIEEYSDLIEEKLLEEIRDMRDDDFDCPEPDYYDY